MHQRRPILFDILKARGITRRWFARQVGINETTLSKIAKGERPIPDWFKAKAAAILQVPESVLFLPSNDRERSENDPERAAS